MRSDDDDLRAESGRLVARDHDAFERWLALPARVPHTTLLFHALFALVLAVAWASLGSQLDVLVGSRGLTPAASELAFLRMQPWVSWLDYPSIFWWGASDAALHAGATAGLVLALAALVGLAPRICFLLSGALYASYVVTCQTFLSFQWDSMLVELCVIAACMSRSRRAPLGVLLARLLLFKLYVESGIAKLESPAHDWTDGTAMRFYYETAPIPTALAFHAHHAASWWHQLESHGTLGLELVVPVAFFLPRTPRYVAAALLTGFQVINLATANYGFFVWMTLALHTTLLDDDDVERICTWIRGRVKWTRFSRPLFIRAERRPEWVSGVGWWAWRVVRLAPVLAYITMWTAASTEVGCSHLGQLPESASRNAMILAETHLANPYHLFMAITTERIEPQFETSIDGRTWVERDMLYKPGDPRRAPPLVAPHQPRVDFRLWFYGLSFQGGTPEYVETLLDRLCHDPAAVQSLFVRRLPRHPRAVRISFWQYHFASSGEHARSGVWWVRQKLGVTEPLQCD